MTIERYRAGLAEPTCHRFSTSVALDGLTLDRGTQPALSLPKFGLSVARNKFSMDIGTHSQLKAVVRRYLPCHEKQMHHLHSGSLTTWTLLVSAIYPLPRCRDGVALEPRSTSHASALSILCDCQYRRYRAQTWTCARQNICNSSSDNTSSLKTTQKQRRWYSLRR